MFRSVKTGRPVQSTHLFHDVLQDSWFTSIAPTAGTSDRHTHEVCLLNAGLFHVTTVLPIMGLFSEKDAILWEKRLRVFARGMAPENQATYSDPNEGGDTRVALFLTEHGFQPFNKFWWTYTR